MQMKLRLALCLILAAPMLVNAGIKDENFGSATVAQVTSIYDGDTFRADIADWPAIVGQRIGVRIKHIDTPELRGSCKKEKALALKAKQFLVEKLRNAKQVKLENIQRDKYFRVLADVVADGESLGQSLIKEKLAVPYEGGTKIDWCKA
ncbi:Micrococcal nuclease-like protein [Hahella chejuensis KCTC 2396]|uniref:Micrococcal nuclease-like protein n=2 Tax=Hahella chejuensis TaxID=158327 RepID=Q2SKK0_HAHCH|nr:Micrococcal nuclease-like protein [Hahella chejuensis KCTC 2396]